MITNGDVRNIIIPRKWPQIRMLSQLKFPSSKFEIRWFIIIGPVKFLKEVCMLPICMPFDFWSTRVSMIFKLMTTWLRTNLGFFFQCQQLKMKIQIRKLLWSRDYLLQMLHWTKRKMLFWTTTSGHVTMMDVVLKLSNSYSSFQ